MSKNLKVFFMIILIFKDFFVNCSIRRSSYLTDVVKISVLACQGSIFNEKLIHFRFCVLYLFIKIFGNKSC